MSVAVGLSFGVACSACRDGRCVDPPTAEEPLCLPLPSGDVLEIAECPNRFCGEEARRAVRFATFARKGVLPVAGGLLDQTAHFQEATAQIWAEEAAYRAKKKLLPMD